MATQHRAPGLRVLPTKYGGVLFRSRLEARWAVFFDALGLRWEYEPEGFHLPSGECYLPDFRLHDPNYFAEVKPVGGDFSKALELATATGVNVWLCEGPPNPGPWRFSDGDIAVWNGCKRRLWWSFGSGCTEGYEKDPETVEAVSRSLSARFGT